MTSGTSLAQYTRPSSSDYRQLCENSIFLFVCHHAQKQKLQPNPKLQPGSLLECVGCVSRGVCGGMWGVWECLFAYHNYTLVLILSVIHLPYLQYIWWYHLFGLLWGSQFIIACLMCTIAGAVAQWFFTREKSELKSPILKSILRIFRYVSINLNIS